MAVIPGTRLLQTPKSVGFIYLKNVANCLPEMNKYTIYFHKTKTKSKIVFCFCFYTGLLSQT